LSSCTIAGSQSGRFPTGVAFGTVRSHLIREGAHRIHHRKVRHGLVVCRDCRQQKAKEEFPALLYGTYRCRNCLRLANQASQARRGDSSPEEIEILLAKQNGGCAICGAREGHRSARGRSCRLAIDHDHQTGTIRGLLCNNCNRGLGRFKDSIALLEAAIRYLKRGQ